MCGIAGVYTIGAAEPDVRRASEMSAVMEHRGPDGHGLWLSDDRHLVLVHRRLSIIDLSEAGAQPMHSADGRYTIVFNGEIYNYIEVREELKKNGCVFNTSTDTEVILQAWRQYGKDCLSKFDGMFAMAIWDAVTKQLFCARDRFGEKPFFFFKDEQQFVFASEIKAIKAYLGELQPDVEYLNNYLRDDHVLQDERTFFKDVHALPPSHWMELSDGQLRTHRYWEINLKVHAPKAGIEEYTEEFRRLFSESISQRLRSDVAVGSSLSGGLDSSAIVSMLHRMDTRNMHTFSARFTGPKDEGEWMNHVNAKTGFPNHQVWPDENGFLKELDDLVWHHEFPPGSASVYAQWCVMRKARQEGVIVLLDGQGADEYLAGYDELKYFAVWEFYRKLQMKRFLREKKIFKQHYGHHGRIGSAFLIDPLLNIFGKRRSVYKHGMDLHEVLKHYTSNKLGVLLRYADRNSMAHSVEVRLPFLYHKLVEFVFSLPVDCIYRDGKTKYILREAVKDVLPEKIYRRTDKIGFAPPQQSWMETEEVKKMVSDAGNQLSDYKLKQSSDGFKNLVTAALLKRFCN